MELSLSNLTLDQKAGQVLAIGFDGTEPAPDLLDMITRYGIGGVILFARNVESPAQVAQLTNALQDAAAQANLPGLILAIDQEGGRVARLTEDKGFTEFPSAMALGATGDLTSVTQAARAIARELRACGLNTNFAPVLDVNNNTANPVIGTRSFGFDPRQVAEFGAAAIDGLQAEGVLACGKHFPGHGDTAQDSHFGLPVVTHDRARLDVTEFVPFRAAIQASVGAIMSAHILYPALEPDGRPAMAGGLPAMAGGLPAGAGGLPATLSPRVMTGLIRDEMGFEGLLCTDSLEMGALATSGYPVPLAAAMALQAGADLLLFNRDHELHRQAHAMIVEWVREGKIPLSRLDEAVRRVLATKQRFGMLNPGRVDPADAQTACFTSDHRQLSRSLARQAVIHKPGVIPLPVHFGRVLAVPGSAGLVQQLGFPAIPVSDDPDTAEIEVLLKQVSSGETAILTLFDAAFRHPAQLELVRRLVAQGIPLVTVALASPFDLEALPENITALAAYGNNPPAIDALAEVLIGRLH